MQQLQATLEQENKELQAWNFNSMIVRRGQKTDG